MHPLPSPIVLVYLCISAFVYMYMCKFVNLYICVSVYLAPVHLCVCVSVYLCIGVRIWVGVALRLEASLKNKNPNLRVRGTTHNAALEKPYVSIVWLQFVQTSPRVELVSM